MLEQIKNLKLLETKILNNGRFSFAICRTGDDDFMVGESLNDNSHWNLTLAEISAKLI